MTERIKSTSLLLLVLLSLFLTYLLWFGHKETEGAAESDYETVYFEEPRLFPQLMVPDAVFINRGDLRYRLRPGDHDFAFFWEEISATLQEITEPADFEYGEKLPEDAALCLTVQFDPFLPLGRESIWLKNSPSGELTGMELWRAGDRCWGILQGLEEAGGMLLPARRGSQLVSLCDQFDPSGRAPCERLEAGEIYVSSGVAVTVAAPIDIPLYSGRIKELILKAETLDSELLLKTFFIKHNLAREIKERDGGLIYTDGEQALRLGNGLDYSHPPLDPKPAALSYSAALQTAGKLLGYYGGWPENLRLERLARETGDSSKGIYNAQWRSYFEGYPLLGETGVFMSYDHGGLVKYRRNLYHLLYPAGDGATVSGYREALSAAVNLSGSAGGERCTLEGMDLAYYLSKGSSQPRAVPVWVIQLNGRELVLGTDDLLPPERWEQ